MMASSMTVLYWGEIWEGKGLLSRIPLRVFIDAKLDGLFQLQCVSCEAASW